MWIKLTKNGNDVWFNTQHVRRIENRGNYGSRVIYNSKDQVEVDQPASEVLPALGYKPPQPPSLETHSTEAGDEIDATVLANKATNVAAGNNSYRALAEAAMIANGKPMTLDELCRVISAKRIYDRDSVRSMLNKEFQRVVVDGDTAWWLNDRPLPA